MPDKLIGQLRLDTSGIPKDIENINKQLSRINNGKDNINLGVDLGNGMDGVIQKTTKFNEKTNTAYQTIKKIKNGLLEITKINLDTGEQIITTETLNKAKVFTATLNTILNQYKNLTLQQQKMPANIQETINRLTAMKASFKDGSSELLRINKQIESLQRTSASVQKAMAQDAQKAAKAAENQANKAAEQARRAQAATAAPTRGQYANTGFEKLLHQYKLQQISMEQFIDKGSKIRSSRMFDMLSNTNQVALVNALTSAEEKRTKALKEQKKIQDLVDRRNVDIEINRYKRLSVEQQKVPSNIKRIIAEYDRLITKYQQEGKEISKLVAERNQYNKTFNANVKNLTSSRTMFANTGFETLMQQYKTQQITMEQFAEKSTRMRNSGAFNLLTNSNQAALVRELTNAEAKLTQARQKAQSIADHSGIQNEITRYRQLSMEQQKMPSNIRVIISEYDKLIARYQQEGKEVSKLIAQRNQYNRAHEQSLQAARRNTEEIFRQYGVEQSRGSLAGALSTNGTMGSGDRRATIGDRVQNSIIYSTSAMAYGSALMGVTNLVKANKEYETGLVNISRTMSHVTKTDIKEMGDASISLGKKYGVAVKDVQTAMTELARAGIDDKKTLQSMAESVLMGINTTEIKDANQMVGYLVSTVKQMGLQFSDTNQIIDEWNYLADKYAVKSDDFAQAIQKSGSAAKNVGINLQELNAMTVVLGERTGKSGTEIGTAFQSLFSKMYRPEALNTLREYGITVDANATTFRGFQEVMAQVDKRLEGFSEGSKDANAILDALGATMRKNDISILAKNWSEVAGIVVEQNKAIGYSIKENEKIMNTLEKQIAGVKVAFTELAIKLGESGLLTQLKMLFGGLKLLVDGFNSLPPSVRDFLFVIADVTIAMRLFYMGSQKMLGLNLQNMFTQIAVRAQVATAGFRSSAFAIHGMAAATRLLNALTEEGTITDAQKLTILQAIRTQSRLATADIALQTQYQQAYTAALTATRDASMGARVAAGAASLGVTVLISGAVYGIMQLMDMAEVAKQEMQTAMQDYETNKAKVEGLRKSLLDNKFTIQDADVAKRNYTQTEAQLKEALGKTTEAIDLQNKSLKEQIGLLNKAEAEAANKFVRENTIKYEKAKEIVGEVGRTGIKTGTGARTRNGIPVKISEDVDVEGIVKETTGRAIKSSINDTTQRIIVEGTLEERYKKLGSLLDVLSEKWNALSDVQKLKNEDLLGLIENVTNGYENLKEKIGLNIEFVKQYEQQLASLKQSKLGEEFTQKFAKSLDEIDKKVKNMAKLPPTEVKSAYQELFRLLEDMQAGLDDEQLKKYKPFFEGLYDSIRTGSDKASAGIDQLDVSQNDFKESTEAFATATQTLSGAYKELNESGELSVESAMTLIERYPQLTAQMTIQNGVIKLNKISLEELFKLEKERMIESAKNSRIAKERELDEIRTKVSLREQEGESIVKLMELERLRLQQTIEGRKKTISDLFAKPAFGMDIMGGARLMQETENLADQAKLNILDANLDPAKAKVDEIAVLNKKNEILSSSKLTDFVADDKKKSTGAADKQEKSESASFIETDRYFSLNNELERTNSLIARIKALQENASDKERVDLMNQEIVLLKKKQDNLKNIANENRTERGELVKELELIGAKFEDTDGDLKTGDDLKILNAKQLLDSKLSQVNAHRNDKDKDTYNNLKTEYEEMKKNLERFFDIQNKTLPDLGQSWWQLYKSITETNKSITDLKVNLQFEDIIKSNAAFAMALANLQSDEKLAGKDVAKQQEIKNKMIELYTDNLIRNTRYLNELNKETDKAKLADVNYQEQKNNLIKTIQDEMSALSDLTVGVQDSKKQAVETTEQKIIEIINKGVEMRKDALKDEFDDYKEHVDKIIEERERQNETDDYKKDISKLIKERQKTQDKINKLTLDGSIEGFQKRKELEAKLAEQNEALDEKRTDRERKEEIQKLKDDVKVKEERTKSTSDALDTEFSDTNKNMLAHKVLMNKSFDEIKGKFPELFKELNSETGNFFKEFQTYEEKFGNIIGDVATKFTTEILPLIKKAVEDIKTIEKDYSGVKFNPNKDYQAELNSMNKAGIFAGDPYYDQMVTERGAKVASLNPLKKITSDASSAVSTAISQQPKSTRYTKEFYANYKFDPTKDYQAEINKLLANGKTMSDPEVIKWQEARAAKIYANPNLVAQYGSSIPSQFRISGSYSQGINKGLVNKTGMYMLHGSKSKPEWVLTNDQMFNFVQGLANNLSSAPSSSMSGSNDIMLNINVAGNADKNTIDGIRDAGKLILLDLKKELNKSGVYK